MTNLTAPLPSPVLVTGATGNVGGSMIARLVADGCDVRALVRSSARAADLIPAGVQLFEGDVTDPASLVAAVDGAATVIHAAGLPEQWTRDPSIFENVNVGGTVNIVDAAMAAGVDRFVHVSTIDVFAWSPGQPFAEHIDPNPKHTAYERSNQAADRLVLGRIEHGLPARIVCPAGVFGPAPTVTPGFNQLLRDLLHNAVPMLLPGGLPSVFNSDCADGIVRVGNSDIGTQAILSESYMTLREIAEMVHDITGTTKIPKILPSWFAHLVSRVGETRARRTNKPPLIPEGQLHFLEEHVVPDSTYARESLGWKPTPTREAIQRTLDWLTNQ